MKWTKKQLKAAYASACNYPPGYGFSYFKNKIVDNSCLKEKLDNLTTEQLLEFG